LEAARQAKVIGHSLDARVTLGLPEGLSGTFAGQEELLSTVCIVSQAVLASTSDVLDNAIEGTAIPGLKILVEAAKGAKCERCWVWSDTVGKDAEQPTVCDRCREALTALGN